MPGRAGDRARHVWRMLNDEDWRYSPRGLLTHWAISLVVVDVVLWLVFHKGGDAFSTAFAVSTGMLLASWWRSKHRPLPRPKAEAAWYPDPSGKHDHRYWDGEHWTDRVLDGTEQSIDW